MRKLMKKFKKSKKEGGEKKMKKALFVIALVAGMMLMVGNAQALILPGISLKFDLETIGAPAGTTTDVFKRISGQVAALSTYDVAPPPGVGANFVDEGVFTAGSLFITDTVLAGDAGLGADWILTANWDDLAGHISLITPAGSDALYRFAYTSGTIALNATWNGDPAVTVAELSLKIGEGSLLLPTGIGSTSLLFEFTDALDGFWLAPDGSDLKATLIGQMAFLDVNTIANTIVVGENADGYATIESINGANIDVLPVPEPTTMLLLGSGLLGLAGIGARKKRK